MPISDPHYVIEKNGSLLLKNVDKTHEGVYKCIISNEIGDELVKSVILTVIGMYTLNIIKYKRSFYLIKKYISLISKFYAIFFWIVIFLKFWFKKKEKKLSIFKNKFHKDNSSKFRWPSQK